MEAIVRLHAIWKNNLYKLKGWLLTVYLRAHGCEVGRGLRAVEFPRFRSVPSRNLKIGNHVSLGSNIVLHITGGGQIELDDHCRLIHDVFIHANARVYIGRHSGIAERCSIRDSEHGTAAGTPMYAQPLKSEPVHIGNDVQVSLGSSVLAGARIADGVIIGAHSLVTRNLRTVENGIYLGNSPKLIGKRVP